jgi:hypothetical protein
MNANGKSAASGAPSCAAIQHTSVATGLTYDALVGAFEHELGYLDPTIAEQLLERKAAWTEVERAMDRVAGPRGLMIIFRADQGKITSLSGDEKRCSLYPYDRPSSFLAALERPELKEFGELLDRKIDEVAEALQKIHD